jgi:hypothetical protein
VGRRVESAASLGPLYVGLFREGDEELVSGGEPCPRSICAIVTMGLIFDLGIDLGNDAELISTVG